jgi:type I restriction enzyme, S subunit
LKNGKKLPEGWVESTLEEVLPIQYGKALIVANRDKGGQIPVYGSSGNLGYHNQALTSKATLIVGRKGSVGSVHYSPVPCWPIDTTYFAEESESVNLQFFLYLLSYLQLGKFDKSTAIPGLSRDDYNSVVVKIAPLAEQRRIVLAIEQQFTRLDAGVAALKSAKAKLQNYRSSVLKAAVDGKLTETWRANHPITEPASKLLERILVERRANWEVEQIAKIQSRGIVPKDDDWKKAYKKPSSQVKENLLDLPEGWCWATLDQCSRRITDGTHQPPPFTETGIPFIFVAHIVKELISFENTKYISEATYKQLNARCPIEYGDILYSAVGSYGVAVPVLTHQPFSFQRHIAHIKPTTLIPLNYLIFCLNSSVCLNQAHKVARGVAQKTVTLTDLARFNIPLAPHLEQEQIVAEVEQRLSEISQLELTIDVNLRRAERERQGILHAAFEGRLVPQDPNDEPADILLEQIQEERVKHEQEENLYRKNKKGSRLTIAGGSTMRTVKKQKLPLYEALIEAKNPISSEDLFSRAGLRADDVDDFYEELRKEVVINKRIKVNHPDEAQIFLEATSE